MNKKGTYDNHRLVELRKALGFTHEQMSRALNMSRSNYTNIEQGKQPFLDRSRQTLIHNLHVNPEWFENINAPMFVDQEDPKGEFVVNEAGALYGRSAGCTDKVLSDISSYYRETFGGMNVEQKMSGYFIVGLIREALSIKK